MDVSSLLNVLLGRAVDGSAKRTADINLPPDPGMTRDPGLPQPTYGLLDLLKAIRQVPTTGTLNNGVRQATDQIPR